MGLLMFLGLIGTMAYGAYYAKNETKAIVSDSILHPSYIDNKDKQLVRDHFKLICKRCNIKVDKNGNPTIKKGYNPCIAYLQYQGFGKPTTDYFKKIYEQKYDEQYNDEITSIKKKHDDLYILYYRQFDKKEKKVFRRWSGSVNVQQECTKMLSNVLWNNIALNYNIVNDGYQKVVVWTIYAPPSILRQLDTIYDEVWYLECYVGD